MLLVASSLAEPLHSTHFPVCAAARYGHWATQTACSSAANCLLCVQLQDACFTCSIRTHPGCWRAWQRPGAGCPAAATTAKGCWCQQQPSRRAACPMSRLPALVYGLVRGIRMHLVCWRARQLPGVGCPAAAAASQGCSSLQQPSQALCTSVVWAASSASALYVCCRRSLSACELRSFSSSSLLPLQHPLEF